ncbi:uncharacterized protein LOC135401002 [Ornithodoros turicata]|uniref:uncharacterized protein LOC135401002 n=1 Tax=Ornithodoros turicata TaxID=34597 RepID=UPI00313937DF
MGNAGELAIAAFVWTLALSLVSEVDGGKKGVTLLDCIRQEIPATVSPKFQECVDNVTVGSFYKFLTGLQCILRLANAIKPDRFVDTALLFSAVGDFKGTRFELAVDKCAKPPMVAMKFTTCLFSRFQEICKTRVRMPG